ncbi:TPA: sugar phosphate isomerase/epimerase, partial [Candidatus Acetothermia bacterium]|nr:sugar phosphate isomerase/epimerase [Candidatus Acetothermia bacterium]
MNRIGIYYAYWERDWAADLVAYPPRAARLGFDVLEVKLSQAVAMPARRRQDLRRSAQDHGIEITFCDGLRQENDISSSDPAVRARGIEHLKRGLDVIHEMGGSVLGGIIYGAWNPPPTKEPAKREHVERSVDSMREIMATAEGLGIACCVED